MDIPVPQPRRKSTTKLLNSDSTDADDHGRGSPFYQSKTIQVVHTVEVHNSLGDTSTNMEDNSSKTSERRKKKLKRKGTFSVNKSQLQTSQEVGKALKHLDIESLNSFPKKANSGTETLSEGSSSSSSSKIKLIPLMSQERKKKPSGYTTETLSEDSEAGKPLTSFKASQDEHGGNYKQEEDVEPPKHSDSENIPLLLSGSLSRIPCKEEISNARSIKSLSPSPKHTPILSTPPSSKHSLLDPLPGLSQNRSLAHLDENQSSAHGSPRSYCTSSSMDYKDTGSLPKQRLRKPRKKKKLRELSTENIADEVEQKSPIEDNKDSMLPEEKRKKPIEESGKFICITIHNCEPLKITDFKTRPFVKLTLMEVDGKLKTNHKGDIIQPVVTPSYDYSFQRSTIPTWNEDLIFMEPLESILNSSTILIIEIFDEKKSKGIAWGFLKPVGANGAFNAGKKLRLQLFKQGKSNKDTTLPQAFYWWKKGERKKYKSTLFLTLAGIPPNMIIKNAVDVPKKCNEISEKSFNKSVENLTESEDRDLEDVRWGRLPSLSCKLPNKFLARLPAGPDGTIAIAYSHSGLLLAAANKINIGVYTFRGRPYLSLAGHTEAIASKRFIAGNKSSMIFLAGMDHVSYIKICFLGLVYCIKWSPNDKYLLSASADFSSCVWDISRKIVSPLQNLSHPSYVYSCAWLSNTTFATGCFDSDIRVWKVGSSEVYQQSSRHTGQINSILSFDNHLISGDSKGAIYIWKFDSDGSIEFERELLIREIKGKIINKLSLHPGKKRLLVHTRDSVLRMVDLATGAVLLWFQGLVNMKLREDSGFCGCGSLVLAWSEDSTLCVWDGNTGAQTALYPGLAPDFCPGALDFHPHDHMMAVSGHSSLTPTLSILTYDRKSNGKEVSLVLLKKVLYGSTAVSDLRTPYSDRSTDSTPKKKESLLKMLLGSRRKPEKDTIPASIASSFTDFSRLQQGASKQVELVDTAEKEGRLSEIIKRMDKILTSVSNNNKSFYSS